MQEGISGWSALEVIVTSWFLAPLALIVDAGWANDRYQEEGKERKIKITTVNAPDSSS
jgi:hypothetical protein